MTISSTTNRSSYAGNGVTTAFSFPYYFLAAADLAVILVASDGTETTQTLTTHYTVSGAGESAGGTVTMLTAPANGETLVIYRDPAITQATDFVPNDPLPAGSLENGLDKLTMISQRLRELIDRSFRLSDGDTSGASTTLPTPTADRLLGWNAAGDAIENKTPNTDAYIALPLGISDGGTGATTAAGARTGLGLGTAATKDTGTANGNVVVLDATGLPAVDASQVTGLNASELDSGTVPAARLPAGTVLQVVNTQTGAVATGTTTIPDDDTIPQNTEGDEYMTLAITPTAADSVLIIEVVAALSTSAANGRMAVALFQDATANALAAVQEFINSNIVVETITFRHKMTAGTTSATTFKVRAGLDRAGTTTFNGNSGARKFGGVMASSITITEVAA